MKVTVDKVIPTPSGLRFGCVVHYSDEGPVRFVDVYAEYDLFTPEVYAAIGIALNRALDREPSQDPLF